MISQPYKCSYDPIHSFTEGGFPIQKQFTAGSKPPSPAWKTNPEIPDGEPDLDGASLIGVEQELNEIYASLLRASCDSRGRRLKQEAFRVR